MTCSVCGSTHPCIHSRRNTALLVDAEILQRSPIHAAEGLAEEAIAQAGGRQWRNEVISRLQQHRARRHRHSSSDESMAFDFPADDPSVRAPEPIIGERYDAPSRMPRREDDWRIAREAEFTTSQAEQPSWPEPPKIIEFPRVLRPDSNQGELPAPEIGPALEDELPEAPRIVEVAEPREPSRPAEQMELLPSFEDIRLESTHHSSLDDAAESVPRPAPLGQRIFGGVVDAVIVVASAEMFNLAFTRMAEAEPHSRVAMLSGGAVGCTLWMLYQYIFLVHGCGTPGMQIAGLEVRTFDDKSVPGSRRRLRAFASTLSAVSLGLGYAWALVDEDQLGWHDRITGTLLRGRTRERQRPSFWNAEADEQSLSDRAG
ncbi:MAG TPA: RDD family protein [Candidatus Limnocylindrales bacterium]|nr:RDD family protein [Candidatus Limnocylindrales bacterium]